MQEEGSLNYKKPMPEINGNSVAYIEGLYEQFMQDPKSVETHWQQFFSKQQMLLKDQGYIPWSNIRDHLTFYLQRIDESNADFFINYRKHASIPDLIAAFRIHGFKQANTNPLGRDFLPDYNVTDLELESHNLNKDDLNIHCPVYDLHTTKQEVTLTELYQLLQSVYCGSIGAEFMHINSNEERIWFQQKLESRHEKPGISDAERLAIYHQLTAAEVLEKYLGSRYPGAKRFGIEGGESLITLLKTITENSAKSSIKDLTIGMAHRGRLNVLINIFGKKAADLFDEFEDKAIVSTGSGDVKYHQGFSSDLLIDGNNLHLSLMFNPSHLEIVGPVVQGSVRARQQRRNDESRNQVLPIVVHGDASFAGQGVVMESLQMSRTRAYKTGGTIHVIINNQVGFTTSNPEDSRSSKECTDIAKMINSPVLHVNGDDPEAVFTVAKIAFDYRKKFNKDIIIDLVCYRRRGHNEADEPSGTQPLMYNIISNMPTTKEKYTKYLIEKNLLTIEIDKQQVDNYRNCLDQDKPIVAEIAENANYMFSENWSEYLKNNEDKSYSTKIKLNQLQQLAQKICSVPDNFKLQRQVEKIITDRLAMANGQLPINWGCAEILAYASILKDGFDIRITGQDVGRGTFAHRHAVLHNQEDGTTYVSLQQITDTQKFEIFDSLLSEEAVLAFEYGFASASPKTLVIWEAQFGDFANGAQVVFDQFISSAEHKWGRLCGLTILLPHGYEGLGPEHSSARLERYLQLCAEHNMQVCVPTTPAQMFHMLRRQMIRPLRKPLIVMTPKSLLRHKKAVSSLTELAEGNFSTILEEDTNSIDDNKIVKVILCSGKVYYDLLEYKIKHEINNTAIVRIEQLYPFPHQELEKILAKYPILRQVVWCQEEPKNQGAWYCSNHHFYDAISATGKNIKLLYTGRPASAAPACGYASVHAKEQAKLVTDAFSI